MNAIAKQFRQRVQVDGLKLSGRARRRLDGSAPTPVHLRLTGNEPHVVGRGKPGAGANGGVRRPRSPASALAWGQPEQAAGVGGGACGDFRGWDLQQLSQVGGDVRQQAGFVTAFFRGRADRSLGQ